MVASGFRIDPREMRDIQRKLEKEFAKHPVRVPLEGGTRGSTLSDVTGSEIELIAGWIIDWLAIHEETNRGEVPTIAVLLQATDNEALLPIVQRNVDAAHDLLMSEGFIHDYNTFRGPGMARIAALTETGRLLAATRRERRENAAARRPACREAVLLWLHAQDAADDTTEIQKIIESPFGWFCGTPFTVDDLVKSVGHLREKGLVAGSDNEPSITAEGADCVERYGGLVNYLNRNDNARVQVTILGDNSGQLAVAGRDNSGQLAVAGRDIEQAQNQQANDASVLSVFAQALRDFATLGPDNAADYVKVAEDLEQEAAKEDRDESWVKALLNRATNLLAKADKFKSLAQLLIVGFQMYNLSHGGGDQAATPGRD
jgi:hypothetical protein